MEKHSNISSERTHTSNTHQHTASRPQIWTHSSSEWLTVVFIKQINALWFVCDNIEILWSEPQVQYMVHSHPLFDDQTSDPQNKPTIVIAFSQDWLIFYITLGKKGRDLTVVAILVFSCSVLPSSWNTRSLSVPPGCHRQQQRYQQCSDSTCELARNRWVSKRTLMGICGTANQSSRATKVTSSSIKSQHMVGGQTHMLSLLVGYSSLSCHLKKPVAA